MPIPHLEGIKLATLRELRIDPEDPVPAERGQVTCASGVEDFCSPGSFSLHVPPSSSVPAASSSSLGSKPAF